MRPRLLATTVLFSLLLAGCTSGDSPGATTDDPDSLDLPDEVPSETPPSKPPTPPKLDVDQWDEPWLKAVNMTRVINCGGYNALQSCLVVHFALDAVSSTRDISVGGCEGCGLRLSVVTDAGERIEGSLISGKTKAVAGFATSFSVKFAVPEGDNVLRLDYDQKHMEIPPTVAPRTYADHGIEMQLASVARSTMCAADLGRPWTPSSAGDCTIAHLTTTQDPGAQPPSSQHMRLRLANGTHLTPREVQANGSSLNVSFPVVPANERVSFVVLGTAFPYTANASAGEATVAAAHAPRTLSSVGYDIALDGAHVSTMCDVLVYESAWDCTIATLTFRTPAGLEGLGYDDVSFVLPNGTAWRSVRQAGFGSGPYSETWNVSLPSLMLGSEVEVWLDAARSPSGEALLLGSMTVEPERPHLVTTKNPRYTCPPSIFVGPTPPSSSGTAMRSAGCLGWGKGTRTNEGLRWEDVEFRTVKGSSISYLANTSRTPSTSIAWCIAYFQSNWFSGDSTACLDPEAPAPTGPIQDDMDAFADIFILFWWRSPVPSDDPPALWSTAGQLVHAPGW